ncbi:hypothetical protein [Streptomyces aidingensis]|uniref:DUF3558 domain-containing protein n=1 Tax=Streptomyces aidingensis TaxID=910347 RepID=A0A1I1FLZ6_9ACTN|nr:hypothetical protein [Streptomyces aidingensis]SFC00006.1 hypothetical protein SAMN05421773_101782 [Streptomyces aidingensis]
MSIPGEPQNPAHPAGGYGYPRQPQPNNPYAQPPATPMPGVSPYGPGTLPGPVTGPGGGRRGGAGWLWGGLAGALLACAGWAGALLVTGNPPFARAASPDFAGNGVYQDLCEVADFAAVQEHYGEPEAEAESSSFSHEDRDAGQCRQTFPTESGEYSSVYVTMEAVWHRAADPAPHFAGSREMNRLYGGEDYTYDARPYEEGLGDEAYLVSSTDSAEDRTDWISLAVREGWLELSISWSNWSEGTTEKNEITQMLHQVLEDTLSAMKDSGGA